VNPSLKVRSCRNQTAWPNDTKRTVFSPYIFHAERAQEHPSETSSQVVSTHFPKLAYKKLINYVTYKLSNAYSLLQIKDHSFYCIKKREHFYIPSVLVSVGAQQARLKHLLPSQLHIQFMPLMYKTVNC
jgi:hypothetical protein